MERLNENLSENGRNGTRRCLLAARLQGFDIAESRPDDFVARRFTINSGKSFEWNRTYLPTLTGTTEDLSRLFCKARPSLYDVFRKHIRSYSKPQRCLFELGTLSKGVKLSEMRRSLLNELESNTW